MSTFNYYVDWEAAPGGDGSIGTPFQTIDEARAETGAKILDTTIGAGDLVYWQIAPGTYREEVSTSNYKVADVDLTIRSTGSAPVIVKASEVESSWTADTGSIYYCTWTNDWWVSLDDEGLIYGGVQYDAGWDAWWSSVDGPWYYMLEAAYDTTVGDARAQMLSRREGVFVNETTPLLQVLSKDDMVAGTFFVDQTADRIYVWLADSSDPANHTMELTSRDRCFDFDNMADIRFERINTLHSGLRGFDVITSTNVRFTRCRAEWNVNMGVQTNNCSSIQQIRSHFDNNGDLGWSCAFCGEGGTLTCDCLSANYNNWHGANADAGNWRVAGIKFYAVAHVTINNLTAIGNYTYGLWFDRWCCDIEINHPYLVNNYGPGLFWEISPGPCVINYPTITGNGLHDAIQPALTTHDCGVLINSASNITMNYPKIWGNHGKQWYIENSGRQARLWGEYGELDEYSAAINVTDHVIRRKLDDGEQFIETYGSNSVLSAYWNLLTVTPSRAETELEPELDQG